MGGFNLPSFTPDLSAAREGIQDLRLAPQRAMQRQVQQLTLDTMLNDAAYRKELQSAVASAQPGQEETAYLQVLKKYKPEEYRRALDNAWDTYAKLAENDPENASAFLKRTTGIEVTGNKLDPTQADEVKSPDGKVVGYYHQKTKKFIEPEKKGSEAKVPEKDRILAVLADPATPEAERTRLQGVLRNFTDATDSTQPTPPGIGKTTKIEKGGETRVMMYNPETGQYDLDQGKAAPTGRGSHPYGAKRVVTFTNEDGTQQTYWADPVAETLRPVKPGENISQTPAKPISDGTAQVITNSDLAINAINDLEKTLGKLSTGPLRGRMASFSMNNLGSAGLDAEEIQIRQKMGRLAADQIFGEGGKALTNTEKEMIMPYVFQQSDTLEALQAKLPQLKERVNFIRNSRFNMLPPRTQKQHEGIKTPGSSGNVSTAPKSYRVEVDGQTRTGLSAAQLKAVQDWAKANGKRVTAKEEQ